MRRRWPHWVRPIGWYIPWNSVFTGGSTLDGRVSATSECWVAMYGAGGSHAIELGAPIGK